MTAKGFVNYRKAEGGGKTHEFFATMCREYYLRKYMNEVKNTLFGGSLKSLISLFVEDGEISDAELQEILSLFNNTAP